MFKFVNSRLSFWIAFLLLCSTGIVRATGADEIYPVTNATNSSQQQTRTVTFHVTDAEGALIGANVMVKGTTTGNITDINGEAVLQNVAGNATVTVSYIGYTSQEIRINNRTDIQVRLDVDTKALDEVVVVGYGSQQRKDITGSVAVVSTEALQEAPVATFAEALQGKASGVYISTTGAPGSPSTIRIRGIGSVNGSDPLIVVDGISDVPIEAVNPNDIESLQVLKDASASAIYGAKGANGVIIITTKQGDKTGTARVSYDGYFGLATMANSGYDVLNGWEAMEFEALGMVNARDVRGATLQANSQFGALDANDQLRMPYATKPAGLSRDQIISQFGSVEEWIADYSPNGTKSWARSAYYQMLEDGYSEAEARKGTDWYDLVVQKGFIQEHQISLLGGGDKGSYSVSVGYSTREGTLKSSYFDRYSLRANSTYIPKKWITLGQNTNLSAQEMGGDRGGGGEGSVYAKTYTMQSWVPVYNVGGDFAGSQSPLGGRDVTSAYIASEQTKASNVSFRGQSTIFAEIKPIEGLSIRSQFSAILRGTWTNAFSPVTIMHNKEGRGQNNFSETSSYGLSWQWTNTATYTKKLNEDNTITVVVGTEALNNNLGRSITATRLDYAFEDDPNTWEISNGSAANQTNSGTLNDHTSMFGLFGRADYSYQGKYLATVTMRRDASSRFAEKNRWGNFPSASVGWRISDEMFMESTRMWLDDLKLRAGYGTTGNSNIAAYNWAFQYGTGNSNLYGIAGTDSGADTGYHVTNLGDPEAKWETVRSLNIGIDATALSNRLTFGIEWYTRKTTDMLVDANWSALAGNATKPRINIGDMENKGIDLQVGWRDNFSGFRYSVSANLSTYRNKILKLGTSDIFNDTRLTNVSITTEGQPIGMLYGYKVGGLYKTEDDVLNYKNDKGETVVPYGTASLEALIPSSYIGRYKILDLDGDGKITAADRTIIGNPHPDFTGGLNLSLGYKNFDFATYLYFSVGNDLFKHYEFYTHYGALQSNYSKDRRDNSWHPVTNPNGKYPLWATAVQEGPEAGNEPHSMYIEDGSYLRMQTLTLGYSLPRNILSKLTLDRLRIYGQVSNVFTVTKYSGLDPEVRTSGDRNRGVDYGAYGSPRQFILGLNISF